MTIQESIDYYLKFKGQIEESEIEMLFSLIPLDEVWPLFTDHLLQVVEPKHYSMMLINAYTHRTTLCGDGALTYFEDPRFVVDDATKAFCQNNSKRSIYRGGHISETGSKYGISWTLSRSIAELYAFSNNRSDTCAYTCSLSDAKVYVIRRNANEEVVAYTRNAQILTTKKTEYCVDPNQIMSEQNKIRMMQAIALKKFLMELELKTGKRIFNSQIR